MPGKRLGVGLRACFAIPLLLVTPVLADGRPSASSPPSGGCAAVFFEGAAHDSSIPPPEKLLGRELGSQPASHAEIVRCLEEWDRLSARMSLHAYGRSHLGRTLYYAVITSEQNHARLPQIRSAVSKLADPRRLPDDAEAQELVRQTPAVAWLGYGVHGDELSGPDAALAVIYHLIAGVDEEVQNLLGQTIILVDPVQNPDGRERFLHQLEAVRGRTPTSDPADWQHTGQWPWGRGNHYGFDLNRDWIAGTQPEIQGRRAVLLEWQPQLVVDVHEMGPDDTYLFTPAREPMNPYLPPNILRWWPRFADEQGQAFDVYGWSYYTREWLALWYPGYLNGWTGLNGAVSILHEQARTAGQTVRQRAGHLLNYPQAIRQQVISTLANLRTLRENRAAILADFLAERRAALEPTDAPPGQTLLIVPSRNRTREKAFLDNLAAQGIEIHVAQRRRIDVANLTSIFGEKIDSRSFGAGTYIIPRAQPAGRLLAALCDFDPRLTDEFLQVERTGLERRGESKLFDITGWSLPLAFGLEAYWSANRVSTQTQPYEVRPPRPWALPQLDRVYAYVIDCTDDVSLLAAAQLLERQVAMRVGDEPFLTAGHHFPRGSFLIRCHENGNGLVEHLRAVAESTGVRVYATHTARSPDEGPDLGGHRFRSLVRPRVALLGGDPFDFTDWGACRHLLDYELGLPVSLLNIDSAARCDLRAYNVIIVPDAWSPDHRLDALVEPLRNWVSAGGTLIAIGSSAAYLADERHGLTQVRQRRSVLAELHEYEYAAARERQAGQVTVDPAWVWDRPRELPATLPAPASRPVQELAALDEWRQRFSPAGTILRSTCNLEHWLAYGCPPELPVFVIGSSVLLSKPPAETPVRLAEASRLRLSGLLWPEAAFRLENSAYLTREASGRGQVILFAQPPNFRGYWHGTRRLLLNAVLLGPGCGTDWAGGCVAGGCRLW